MLTTRDRLEASYPAVNSLPQSSSTLITYTNNDGCWALSGTLAFAEEDALLAANPINRRDPSGLLTIPGLTESEIRMITSLDAIYGDGVISWSSVSDSSAIYEIEYPDPRKSMFPGKSGKALSKTSLIQVECDGKVKFEWASKPTLILYVGGASKTGGAQKISTSSYDHEMHHLSNYRVEFNIIVGAGEWVISLGLMSRTAADAWQKWFDSVGIVAGLQNSYMNSKWEADDYSDSLSAKKYLDASVELQKSLSDAVQKAQQAWDAALGTR